MSEEHIRAIAHLDARLEKTEEVRALLTSLLEPRRQERGCIRFELQQNRDSPTEFAVVSEWRGEEVCDETCRPHISQGH
jgi:quinol monooxygenase YgiN